MAFVRENALRLVQTWALGADETGAAPDLPGAMIVASVQITGTLSSATVVLEVSNDGTNWVQMKDKDGTDVAAAAAAFFDLSSAAGRVRAKTVGGDGSTAADVALVVWQG